MSIKCLEVPERKPYSSDMKRKTQMNVLKIPPAFPENCSYTDKNIINAPEIPCIVCYTQMAAGVYTDCEHKVVCIACAQSHFLAALQANEHPKCLVSSCTAPFLESSISIFHQFSQKTKKKWRGEEGREYLRKNSSSHDIFRACQFPNCQGFINPKSQICVTCDHKHCQQCSRLQHNGACKTMTVIQGPIELKTCKYCKGKIYKEGGCSKIVCQTCRRQICYECGQQWSYKHHGCESGGWIKLPYYYFIQKCFSDKNVDRTGDKLI